MVSLKKYIVASFFNLDQSEIKHFRFEMLSIKRSSTSGNGISVWETMHVNQAHRWQCGPKISKLFIIYWTPVLLPLM